MQIKKVLSRKDAYSVLLAIVLAQVMTSPLFSMSADLTARIFQSTDGPQYGPFGGGGGPLKEVYLKPIVMMLLSIVMVEVVIRIVQFVQAAYAPRKK